MSGSRLLQLGYLLLDDGEKSRRKVKDAVNKALGSACFQLEIDSNAVGAVPLKEATNLDQASEFVNTSDKLPNWLLIDSKLEGESGRELVNLVAKIGYPADVLYYSRADSVLSLKGVKLPRYGKVSSIIWAGLEDKISVMAQEFLLKWTDPEYVRGLVLSRAVDVDIAIDDCIISYFRIDNSKELHFRSKLLGVHGAQLQARLGILEKALCEANKGEDGDDPVTKYEKLKKSLGDIYGTRDLFAHNILSKDQRKKFTFKLVHKSSGEVAFDMEKLPFYFLSCCRSLSKLEKLEEDLENIGGKRSRFQRPKSKSSKDAETGIRMNSR